MPTGFQLNLSSAYSYTANREAVTLWDALGNSYGTIPDAKRLMAGTREREVSLGDYLQTEIDFRLPALEVSAAAIVPGFNIVDATSTAYVVIRVDPPSTYSTVWKCACRQVKVQGLYNLVDWKRINQTTNAYADRITDPALFSIKAAAVPARIQPRMVGIKDILGKRGALQEYDCYVLPDWQLQAGDLIVDTLAGNQMYKVVGWDSKEDLACALHILLEILP